MAGSKPIRAAQPDFSLERDALDHPGDLFQSDQSLSRVVIGVDEAGRGPWAGPVTAGAAWIDPEALCALPKGLNDSKKISASKRADLFQELAALPQEIFRYAVVSRDAAFIDEFGILPATFSAMDEAASLLINKDDALSVLVDGNLAPPFRETRAMLNTAPSIMPIIKGDARSLSIAAASIMAKETRDQIMIALNETHPGYGWDTNMGYGTADHRQGLAKQGPTQHHRLSYKPVSVVAGQFGYTR